MRTARHRRVSMSVVAVVVCVGLVTGCGASHGNRTPTDLHSGSAGTTGLRGDVLGVPVALTAAVSSVELTSGAGGVTLGQLQRQHPILVVYFGYTSCPDVCPATMADIGIGLRQLTPSAQRLVQVVFVTSDPARDTTTVLTRWLANFDAGLPLPFIGLRGSVAEIDSIGTALGVPLRPPTKQPDGTIDVEHGTQVLAFVNGSARLAWLADTTSDDYRHDLALLARPLGA